MREGQTWRETAGKVSSGRLVNILELKENQLLFGVLAHQLDFVFDMLFIQPFLSQKGDDCCAFLLQRFLVAMNVLSLQADRMLA